MGDSSLGKAVLELAADGTGLTGDLQTAEDKVRTSAALMQRLLGAIGISFSLKAVLDATVEAEHEEMLLANAVKATGMAAGFTTEQLKAQQVVLQSMTGIGDETISSMQRALVVFRNVHGEVFKSTIKLALDFAAATGGDATNAVRMFGIALNDPVNNMMRLKRAGVDVSDALKSQIEQLIRSGDLVGAQTLLINELSKSYNGAAVAARDTLGGAIKALKENFANLFLEQQGVGEQLRSIIEHINKFVVGVANLTAAAKSLHYFGQGMRGLIDIDYNAAVASFGKMAKSVDVVTDAMGYTKNASTALAATSATTAGVVNAASQAMMNQMGKEQALAAEKASMQASLFQAEMVMFLQKSAAKTAAIQADAAWEVDTVRQKYALMAAEAQLYFDDQALKLQQSTLNIAQYGFATVALEQERQARLSAIAAAAAKAQTAQDIAQRQIRLNAAAGFFGNMQTLLANSLGEQNALTKANAIVLGTVQAFAAANNALATPLPWPIPQAMAAVALAAGLSNVAKMKALGSGGPMMRGETALVGEGGPELFTAPRSGHIIPNGEFGGAGGIQVTNNISVAGLDFSSETIAERILNGIADAAKRGTEAAIPAANAFNNLSLAYSGRAA